MGGDSRMDERVAVLEAYSKTHHDDLVELHSDLKELRVQVECIRRDLHAARWAGRAILAIAMTLGAIIGWAVK